MNKGEIAKDYFTQGYNCAQAVAMAFAPEMNMEPEVVARMVSSFGGGMGRMREVCGAVSGMFFVLGVLKGYNDPKDDEGKMLHYAKVQELAADFIKENGSIICRDLLSGKIVKPSEVSSVDSSPVPSERTEEYYKKRPCAQLVEMAANILCAKL